MDAFYDTDWQPSEAESAPAAAESCNPAPKQRKNGAIVPFKRETPLPDPEISERARLAIDILKDEFEAVSGDPQRTAALWKALGILGRPSGSSPPQPAQPALELPTSPPAWWRDRQPGETPDNWLRTHYKPYIDTRLLTRGFFQRPGQDKAFANALLTWEKDKQLPPDLYLPTKSELVDRQLQESGGIDKALEQGRAQFRDAGRLYNAARRRSG